MSAANFPAFGYVPIRASNHVMPVRDRQLEFSGPMGIAVGHPTEHEECAGNLVLV